MLAQEHPWRSQVDMAQRAMILVANARACQEHERLVFPGHDARYDHAAFAGVSEIVHERDLVSVRCQERRQSLGFSHAGRWGTMHASTVLMWLLDHNADRKPRRL